MQIITNGGIAMLFRKKIERSCSYCVHSTQLDDGLFLCAKKGFRSQDDQCSRFRYDPCKRVPSKAKALDFSRYQEEDFSL